MDEVKWNERIGFGIGVSPFWWRLRLNRERGACEIFIGPFCLIVAWS